jgi:hypothetical protein
VKVGAATGLSLVKINRYCLVIRDDAEESSLPVPDSAPNAGTHRNGHRNRLDAPRCMAYSNPLWDLPIFATHVCRLETARERKNTLNDTRWPSWDGSRQRAGKCSRHSGLKVRRIPIAPHSSSASRTRSSVRRGSE